MRQVPFDEVVNKLVDALESGPVLVPPKSETEFDRDFVAPTCEKILREMVPNWDWAVHPWGDKGKAKAWKESKKWGAISTWGMHHTLDLVARESSTGKKLGVEIKLAKVRGRPALTGDFQRMVGQCLIGRLVHHTVIGLFGILPVDPDAEQYVDVMTGQFKEDAEDYRPKLEQNGIRLIVRRVDAEVPAS